MKKIPYSWTELALKPLLHGFFHYLDYRLGKEIDAGIWQTKAFPQLMIDAQQRAWKEAEWERCKTNFYAHTALRLVAKMCDYDNAYEVRIRKYLRTLNAMCKERRIRI
jgi:hypothetical protein